MRRIEGQRAVDPGRDRDLRRRGHQQRVAVGLGPGDRCRADRPAAPPRLSITTVWPSSRPAWSAARRASTSIEPAAANGTTSVIGCVGKSSARAAERQDSDAPSAAASRRRPNHRAASGDGQHDLARRLAREQRVHRIGPFSSGKRMEMCGFSLPSAYQASSSSKFLRPRRARGRAKRRRTRRARRSS